MNKDKCLRLSTVSTIIFLFLLITPSVYSQVNTKEIKNFYSQILKLYHPSIKDSVAQWDMVDYDFLRNNPTTLPGTLYENSAKFSWIKGAIDKTHYSQINTLSIWTRSVIPGTAKIMRSKEYTKKAKLTKLYRTLGFGELFAISLPIFSSDKKNAIIKIDYSGLKIGSNTCSVWYFYFEVVDSQWTEQGSSGYYCLIE